jgi:hypothetical protein
MRAIQITILSFLSLCFASAEPAGFEIQNKSERSERITISNGASKLTIELKSGENFVYRTMSSMSEPIALKSFIHGFPDESNKFQWATFTIDKSGRYLSTFANQASKLLPIDDITSKASTSFLSNEYVISITSSSEE